MTATGHDNLDRASRRGVAARIAAELRGKIRGGRLKPGERLPSNTEMQARYGVTGVTVCRAVRRLVRDGYLESRHRSGVFVAARPSHLCRFGLAFHSHPGTGGDWSRMEDVLHAEAVRGIASLDCEFARYYDVGAGARAADYQRLGADAANACIGGLLFTTDPWQLWDAPFVRQPDLRKAGIMSAGRRGDMDAVVFHSFYGLAMEWLAEHGRRRVAAICASTLSGSRDFIAGIHGQAEQCGLVLPPHWLQFADFSHPAAVRPLVKLLLASPPSERPQALLVGDDNLTPDVELVLLELGIRVPKELEVVAHCNFPPPALQRLPMRRIGYDLRQLLCDVVAQFRNGRRNGHPEVIAVPPLWEDEFAARWNGGGNGQERLGSASGT